jgi:hypothetical protein
MAPEPATAAPATRPPLTMRRNGSVCHPAQCLSSSDSGRPALLNDGGIARVLLQVDSARRVASLRVCEFIQKAPGS